VSTAVLISSFIIRQLYFSTDKHGKYSNSSHQFLSNSDILKMCLINKCCASRIRTVCVLNLQTHISRLKALRIMDSRCKTPCSRTILDNVIVAQLIKKFPFFMDPEGSVLCSQELATPPCPQPDESSSHPILKDAF
jgi:hypothetical protein